MKLNRRIKLKLRNAMRRSTSLFLAFLLIFEVSYPTQLLALTGGPSQPEVQSFEPIGTSDMVDVFSGDFNYNLPLMDVEGYPINIAYHSGVGMDQEASWVGLGWNINPGVINRNMRGLPDDFSGDAIQKEISMKPNKTWGVAAELQLELYGYEGSNGNTGSVNLGFSFGFNFNNYTGPSITQGINLSLSCGNAAGGGLNAGLGLNSSSDDGLTIQPSAGFSARIGKTDNTATSIGVNIGTAFNSRGGLKQLTINAAVTMQVKGSETKAVSKTDENGVTSEVQELTGKKGSASMGGQIAGATFDYGTATYNPSITNSMKNYGLSGKFTLGGELWGIHGKIGVSGFYSSQSLAQNNLSNPAYGYLYSENGQDNDKALMDFNREKDGPFNENMACLPLTNYTFDTYAVMGQGIGGSYRPFRSDIGNVSDPSAFTTNDDASLTIELGFGGWVHVGTNISVTDVSGNSGKWRGNNYSLDDLRFTGKSKGSDFENVYFKEANEKTVESDDSFFAAAGGDSPLAPPMDVSDKYEPVLNSIGQIKRKKRDKRTQNMYFVKRSEYNDFAIKPIANTYAAPGHHIAEVTTLATDGARYVFGIAAYNTLQREATFSVGSTNPATASSNLSNNGTDEASKGLIGYASGVDNSTGNGLGIDNFFSRTTTPGYAHSYLLTSVLSPDYIDADATRGPSDGDFGSYTRFAYKKINNYKWRTPFEKASFTEGLKSDLQDDKANYIYGEKELWYLDSVITKNYVAVFHKSLREDAVGVKNENGGYSASDSEKMMKLDSISLYSKSDLKINGTTALPIKRVHFEYDYSLCKGIPNVTSGVGTKGKLTLKKIYYTYQNSNKARLSPYQFSYGFNPNYNLKGYDRWGNFKLNQATSIGVRPSDVGSFVGGQISPSDYPYAEQDRAIANQNASAWSLEKIQLPSGGTIKVSYESDDYAYVQNRQAMEMFKIVNVDSNSDNLNGLKSFASGGTDKFYFKLEKDHNNNYITDIHKYTNGISNLYFRFLVNIRHVFAYDNLEYVSGYGEIDPGKCGTDAMTGLGWIGFKSVKLKDNGGGATVNPIIKTSIQYARLYLSKKAFTSGTTSDISEAAGIENGNGLGLQILDALINSSFTKNIKDAIQGPNDALYSTYNVGKQFVTNKSWVRLMNPNKKKLGGGARVKQIEMIDEWGSMIGGTTSDNATYGQKYSYTLDDGTSSGVATYEPQLGGDENPFRQPLPYNIEKLMVPDDQFYQEEPMGESFFPSPSIGYSKVTVKNLNYSNVTRHATGKVVHEFYTAKDFPIVTNRSDVNAVRGKDDPWSIRSLLKIDVRDYLTAAQGFVVELNDMHGKPKGQTVYQEGQTTKISSIEYRYKQETHLGNFKVSNKCTTIDKNGTIATKKIGELFDMVADFREDKTTTNNISLGVNIDVIPMGPVPGVIPSMWPSFAKQTVRFRSATTTKVIQRFGILEETIATDLGSTVSTRNLAFDAETGGVLLTETTTNFNDTVYSFKYPAWWYYDNMGPAYQNIGFEMDATFVSGVANVGGAAVYFREGDELAIPGNPVNRRIGWVTKVTANTIEAIDKTGAPVNVSSPIKVIRSGKRNTMITDMATITTLSNPINSLNSNVYQNVLHAGAVEFSNKRKTYCNCIASAGSPLPPTTNPYVLGTKGNWAPFKSHTHLTGRNQSNYNTNTNIRKDGMFTSYTPYYKLVGGTWQMDAKDWTYVSEITEFTPFGVELENRDALSRYSSATFGYNQSMALSVAANSQYKEQGFDGFEDYAYNPCLDDHFKFTGITPASNESHTGKYSLKVPGGTTKKMARQIAENCVNTSECQLAINKTELAVNLVNLTISNATGAASVSWNILSGNPQITPNSNGSFQILGTSYQIEITVTDGSNCAATKTVSN
ncbi:MAG: hypothetical protein K0S53_1686 [Bacteroidetes bacterium]|jgi:hypothetical protein|nr:hypothetical protein [Bacteroidota bacterium]MDF2450523.1 hypothetical protein [Bacteroidota bacterium]